MHERKGETLVTLEGFNFGLYSDQSSLPGF